MCRPITPKRISEIREADQIELLDEKIRAELAKGNDERVSEN